MANAVQLEYQNQANGVLQCANPVQSSMMQGSYSYWPQGNYLHVYPYTQTVIVNPPAPPGLLNEKAHNERQKIIDLIGEEAVEKLVKAGYEVVRV